MSRLTIAVQNFITIRLGVALRYFKCSTLCIDSDTQPLFAFLQLTTAEIATRIFTRNIRFRKRMHF